MICRSCGTQNIPGAKFCDNCGLTLPQSGSAPELAQPAVPLPPPTTSLKAVFSLVCALLVFVPFSSVGAIVLGHWSRGEIKRSAGGLKGSGLALAGLVLGYATLVLAFVVIGLAIYVMPKEARSALTIGWRIGKTSTSVAAINVAQKTYRDTYHQGYACSLAELGGRGGGKEHAGLIDAELSAGEKDGYVFELGNCDDHQQYTIVAYPRERTNPHLPSFCSDQSGTIKNSDSGTAEGCLGSAERGR